MRPNQATVTRQQMHPTKWLSLLAKLDIPLHIHIISIPSTLESYNTSALDYIYIGINRPSAPNHYHEKADDLSSVQTEAN